MMKKIEVKNLSSLFSLLAQNGDLYLPVKKNGKSNFAKFTGSEKYCSEELKTVKSAKDLFFPQSENIVSFERTKDKINVKPLKLSDERFVIFGVRACDQKSFGILDKVFLSEPADEFYKSRRENGVIITVACNKPEETCFCSNFGVDNASSGGDIESIFVGDELFFKANTKKGEELLNECESLLLDADENDVCDEKAKIKEITEKLPLSNLDLSRFGAGKTDELFDDENWDSLSEACLGCGTCTFVCPTCQCYDIRDFDTGSEVKRYRCWDSCMYNDFTMCAHGTNRPTQKQRFRQRFMHKLVYFPDNNEGEFSCVGCGRCVASCPISMNIAKVIKTIGGEKK